ncbi:dipeptide ABC transporter ATP-binding protein [Paenibacillus sp. 481]|uniref:dipeptide ABC transporter ATP-binding protein n=1 Tax=Paenibacillus sp. 481 TaxID=2835869 RepID=UPI001E5CF04C|nr:ABC transporter ATP-binding protein [Paenibacillus sp. 481]UHA71635.1 ABC transporter ATP-binding protein [Paenibacillus sp. 481]
MEPLLTVSHLTTCFEHNGHTVKAVDDVSFTIERGEMLGLIGPSGCGKSTIIRSLLRLLEPAGCHVSGAAWFDGIDLLQASEKELNRVRWARISVIPQSAMNALNPVCTVGEQIVEVILRHEHVSRALAQTRMRQLLDTVAVGSERGNDYPHQFSGGMKQRIAIAMALACQPDLIICDEATTGLDVIIQSQIVALLKQLQVEHQLAVLFVSHDLPLVTQICDRIAVMQAGKIVSSGAASELTYHLTASKHTSANMSTNISTNASTNNSNKKTNTQTSLNSQPHAQAVHAVQAAHSKEMLEQIKIVHIEQLHKTFAKRSLRSFFRRRNDNSKQQQAAVAGVDLHIHQGEIVGLIGESGSGKSTLGRMLIDLVKPSSGRIFFQGTDLLHGERKQIELLRSSMQMIFQDPYDTLNPDMSTLELLLEPVQTHMRQLSQQQQVEKAMDMLSAVGLTPIADFVHRYPHELSGGQRQRVAIARALILEPAFLIADEPTSMLDEAVRNDILQLLLQLKQKLQLTILLITHDLTTASSMCDRIAVMYRGKIVEMGPANEVLCEPSHPYTRALVAVNSDLRQFMQQPTKFLLEPNVNEGILSTENRCAFAPRCPQAVEQCRTTAPNKQWLADNHYAVCFTPHISPDVATYEQSTDSAHFGHVGRRSPTPQSVHSV